MYFFGDALIKQAWLKSVNGTEEACQTGFTVHLSLLSSYICLFIKRVGGLLKWNIMYNLYHKEEIFINLWGRGENGKPRISFQYARQMLNRGEQELVKLSFYNMVVDNV